MQIFAHMVNFTIKHEFLWFNLKTLKGNGIVLLSHEDYANYTCQTLGFYDIYLLVIYGKKYSRMVQVKFVEDKQTTSLQIF